MANLVQDLGENEHINLPDDEHLGILGLYNGQTDSRQKGVE
uniref:Uncharacterized protein n=1 Tax=Anguilla anguilla TaxID=7936 RepID=A0A0E9RJV4_ANGAN